jgi:hypothetical protein
VDLKRAAMLEAIAAYSQALIKAKPIGLVYFAGHGVQLDWRNYLVPVDARITGVEDVRAHCVDMNEVLAGIAKAGNAMNVIILDACRDNPFGRELNAAQKGLSQVDAPPGTLLAYATSPGNVASDGAGANGLYTENLLREIKVPEAKIEDVFKRVRLAVRRSSNGQQIPWESTSLEEDFWFIPPADLKKRSDREAQAQYKREADLWEQVKAASQPGPLEDYLRRYPSGQFAELAQLELDRVLARMGEKKVQTVSSPLNPYSQGAAAPDTAFKVGDRYSYEDTDLLTKLVLGKRTMQVTSITQTEVVFNKGRWTTDRSGNMMRSPRFERTANQTVPAEFAIGKRWTTRYVETPKSKILLMIEVTYRITRKERITVPAGSFDAFVVEYHGWVDPQRGANAQMRGKIWFAPAQARREVAREHTVRTLGAYRLAERTELTAFKQS